MTANANGAKGLEKIRAMADATMRGNSKRHNGRAAGATFPVRQTASSASVSISTCSSLMRRGSDFPSSAKSEGSVELYGAPLL